ncbi:hypothetical protein [Eubacterium sp.]|uniref:hypothetical protein n=1 Tax=Eubacterium sp. TaxID=142586 RepID=UPI0025D67F8C|nr:hypothetical protein [Eubacterium sp.]MCR5629821.1 hypothetical protein [Eubacterium sp.]
MNTNNTKYYQLQKNGENDNYILTSCDFMNNKLFKILTPYEKNLYWYMLRQLYSNNNNRIDIKYGKGEISKYLDMNYAALKIQQDGIKINKKDIRDILFTFTLAERKEIGLFTNKPQFTKAKNKLIKYGFIGEIVVKRNNGRLLNVYYISDGYKRKNILNLVIKDNNAAAEQDTRNEQDKVI